jgi:hypothetical protein
MMKIFMWVGENIMLEAMKSKRVCEESEKKGAKMKMDDGEYKTVFFLFLDFFFVFLTSLVSMITMQPSMSYIIKC